jgi:tetratricopeptide (TPR) repeat protein
MLSPSGDDALTAAERALELALRDPVAALRAADEIVARRPGAHAASVAHRAAGLALLDIGTPLEAARRFRKAIAAADRQNLRRPAAQARMSLAVALAALGRLPAALHQLDRAAAVSRGADAAEVLAQRALLLGRAGRYGESMAAYARAMPVLARSDNPRFEALALLNRGALRAMHGDLRTAEADLRRCADLARAHGFDQVLADAENNLGYVAACAGDVPAALAAFARAEQVPGIGPAQLAATWTDRATALLGVGLAADATSDAARAVELLHRTGRHLDAASARLLLAEALLADGDPAGATALAGACAVQLQEQHRAPLAHQAVHLEVLARFRAGETGAALLRTARANAAALQATGHPRARDARILLARILIARDRTAEAVDLLADADRRAPARTRVAAWTARAVMHHQNGATVAARRAVRTGLRVLTEHAAALGASELRVAVAADGHDLADLGVRLALRTGDPAQVITAAEALRARSLDHPPTRPPADKAMAADLAALRRLTAGHHDGPTSASRIEQLRLERAIRDRTRSAPAADAARVDTIDLRALRTDLGHRALISYLRSDGELHAVTVVDGAQRLHRLGPWDPIGREIAAARFAAHRLWRAQGSIVSLAGALETVERAGVALDDLLLAPLPETAGRGLVLAPTADLHALPWGLLPSTRGRAVSVVPSIGWWQRRPARARAARGALVAAGPGAPNAAAEARAVAALRPGTARLTGRHATVDAVLAGLDGAAVGHLACHGRFRADHPDFSCVDVADGPLTVHDFRRLRRPPRLLVLSACEAARSAIRPGDELMGIAAALLGAGTRTLIAPVTAVPDREARTLMTALHRRLVAGDAPAAALARAAADTGVVGFTCFGD